MREDGAGPVLQAAHAIHGDEADILHPTGLDLIEYLHPCVLALRLVQPQAEDVLAPVHVVAEDRVHGALPGGPIAPERHVQAVDEHEGIEGGKLPALPFAQLVEDIVRDVGYLLMGQLEPIDVVDGGGDVPLAHAARVHGEHLALDGGHVPLVLGHNGRLEGGLPISWNFDWNLPHGGEERLGGMAVAAVGARLLASLMVPIAEVVLHFAIEHGLKHGTENLLESILHVFHRFGLVLVDDCLGNLLSWGIGFL